MPTRCGLGACRGVPGHCRGVWREDLDIVRKLNLNSYRFSLEWARIEPEEGQFSHRKGYAAIKNIRPALPVGVALTMTDDQSASTDNTHRNAKRAKVYGAWFDAVKGNADFLGVQNYERAVYDQTGLVAP